MARSRTEEYLQYLFNHQVDDTVSPGALVIGIKGKADNGGYYPIKVDTDGEIQVDVVSSALPTDAATEDTLAEKLNESTFTGRVGEVQASPTANTLLGRLKSVEDKLDTLETSANAVQTAVEKMDNQEDEVSYVSVAKSTTDGDIIAAPGSGHHLRIHHISVNNHGANFTKFQIRDGSGGTIIRDFGPAAEGGVVEVNLKRPIGLTANTALYYDYESGASADIAISVHYEDITD